MARVVFRGVVSYNGSSADFGDGEVSPEPHEWLAKTSLSPLRSYDYFYKLLGSPTTDSFDGSLPSADGVYFKNGDVSSLSQSWNPGGGIDKKIIILINGNLTIDKRITVDESENGFLAFIVSGSITIDSSLGNNPAAPGTRDRSNIEGVFICDGTFNTSLGDNGKERFVGEGIFVAGGFNFGRDLEDYNGEIAAELFVFRPDFLINSPQELWQSNFTWEEIAP